ncbi:helix-turn-helix domain-containing protein [Anaerobium acetethylicum]|uniref:helix-turn-helix domain-containing protein n=1 Tax=Anaerobium acetethylicum TaxID=1619234 RepID=UPI000B80E98E|nr:helix-turn-helix domain-containing protein [Anaerobium acetethylicum]
MQNIEDTNIKVLNAKELQELFGFGKTKMCELMQSGVLPVVKIGRDYITTKNALEKWIEDNIGNEIFY